MNRKIIVYIVAVVLVWQFVVCVDNIANKDSSTNFTTVADRVVRPSSAHMSSILLQPNNDVKPYAQPARRKSSNEYDPYANVVNAIDAPIAMMPMTRFSSQKTVRNVGTTQVVNDNNNVISHFIVNNFDTKHKVLSVIPHVWAGNVSSVAAATASNIAPASGELPADVFAMNIRKVPPTDPGNTGDNGPGLDMPLGDGILVLLLMAIAYICYIRRTTKAIS